MNTTTNTRGVEIPGLIGMSDLLRKRGVETRSFRDHEIAEAAFRAGLEAALSAQQGQGEAVNVPGYDVGWKIRGVTAYDEAKRKGYRHPECVEAAIKAAPPAPEPAAQGEEGFDVRKYVRHMADVLEAGGDLFKVDADLLRLAAAINKAANTAPPAQPAAQGDGLCQRNPVPNAAPAVGVTSAQRIVYLSPEGTAPPAQPERVPDPETACAMWIKPTTTEAESNAFLAGARAMLAQSAEPVTPPDDAIFVGTPWEQRKRAQPAELKK